MKRVAVIVQRYGVEVNGGAEVHARMIAEQLARTHDVTVLTSCAVEYQKWHPEYPPGEALVNGIRVIRFMNSRRGTPRQLKYTRKKAGGRLIIQKLHRILGKPSWMLKTFPETSITEADWETWLKYQGPYMPDLLNYLSAHHKEYEAYIFFTALYYPTAMGVLVVPEKSILIPTMHDEKPMYMPGYRKTMSAPAWIMFNTEVEQRFSEGLFSIERNRKMIAGVGITLLKDNYQIKDELLQKHNIPTPFIVYIGRVDANKGCDVLIKYFLQFRKETQLPVTLVMVGNNMLKAEESRYVIYTGFVDDDARNSILMKAEALVIPSFFESLSLVLLESMGAGKPVIANGKTEVLREHVNKSGGGWNYFNYNDFKKAMTELLNNPAEKKRRGDKGFEYVRQNYTWDKVLSIYDEAIEDVSKA